MSSNILTLFNDHFFEFVTDICNVFPDEMELATCKNSLVAIRKVNPKMIPRIWKQYIASKYQQEIESGDIDFFINKDYSSDLSTASNSDKIMEQINKLRDPIKKMSKESQDKTIKYIQNLTKLALLYN